MKILFEVCTAAKTKVYYQTHILMLRNIVVVKFYRPVYKGYPGQGSPEMASNNVAKSGIAVGINHGHITTPRNLPARPSSRKGVITSSIFPSEGVLGFLDEQVLLVVFIPKSTQSIHPNTPSILPHFFGIDSNLYYRKSPSV